jgi:2-hydroxy-3-oxopropionate reductase
MNCMGLMLLSRRAGRRVSFPVRLELSATRTRPAGAGNVEAYGVDTTAAVEVLGGGLAGSAVLNHKAQNMLTRSFDPGFRIDLHHKDLGILTTAARAAGVITPLGAMVAQLMASARAHGDGALDHSALLRGVERLSGRERID